MLSKNQIKFIKSLQQKKFRAENALFLAEGTTLVHDLLLSNILKPSQVFASEAWLLNNNIDKGIGIIITERELRQISGLETPNEVLAVFEIPNHSLEKALASDNLLLALDGVRDPGNLGTIIRIADWFGISHIVCSEDTVDAYNPKVVQASMGSIARVYVHYTDLGPFLEKKKEGNEKIYAALLEGSNVYKEKLSHGGVLIMGNEAKGISQEVLKYVTHGISIPAFPHAELQKTKAESLNVAVAAAILCAEFRKG